MTDVMREYASALFELACEEGSTEETGRALRDVQALMTRYPAWLETLSCPAVDAADRERALEEALGGRVPGVVLFTAIEASADCSLMLSDFFSLPIDTTPASGI